jgi:hypothetical protein
VKEGHGGCAKSDRWSILFDEGGAEDFAAFCFHAAVGGGPGDGLSDDLGH